MAFIRSRLSENLLNNFDVDLQTFYNRVLNKELNLSDTVNTVKVKKALKEVVHAYIKETVDSLSSSILFDSVEKRYAYVLKHCPCFTSAVARHFHRLLLSNPCVIDSAIQRRRLNLCCLGGGPATDAVAVAKIVNSLNSHFVNAYSSELQFNVSVVDLSEDWQATAKKVVKTVEETSDFCDEDRMRVTFEFLKADLTEKWQERVKGVLSNADIVTMVYFVSAVNGSRVMKNCSSMLQNIMNALKPGALLFFLDSSKDIHYKTIRSASCPFKDLKQIYGPHLQEFHTLTMKSIKRFTELYSDQFNISMCLTNCFISCAGWIKESIPTNDTLRCYSHRDLIQKQKALEPITCLGQNSLRKMVTFNTKKQEHFRQKIEQLFMSGLKVDFVIEDLEDCEDDYGTDSLICDDKVLNPTKSKRKRIVTWHDDGVFWIK